MDIRNMIFILFADVISFYNYIIADSSCADIA